MKLLLLGLALIAIDYAWLAAAVPGENPLVYAAHSRVHFWTFLSFSSLAHVVLAIGASLYLLERRARDHGPIDASPPS